MWHEGAQRISLVQMWSRKRVFKATQIIVPLLPIPLGCWFLYKALKSFNRNPPPIATDSATVLERPLYAEPVYQSISYKPSTFMRNATPRGG